MKLLIENAQLLKPYTAPYSRKEKKHRAPKGWTPTRTSEMHATFTVLQSEYPTTPDYMLWSQVEADEGKRLAGNPWPGWMPVNYKLDKEIGDAYYALFLRMNGEYADLLVRGVPLEGRVAEWPPDGEYVFEDGVMRLHAIDAGGSLTVDDGEGSITIDEAVMERAE